ncbi:MAG TPA: alcohol dehydrogenase, partial [Bacteroidales bacterium]|nr:alcohol dehydrogenase [Bacteroidales bacterium]
MYQISEIKLPPTSSIREALRVIDKGAMKIALVVDPSDRLIGTLSDGDIRRGILAGLGLEDAIETIY